MKISLKKITLIGLASFCFFQANSQKTSKDDILYKKRIVKALDLREKQNKPLFAQNNELTKTLLNSVLQGELKAYKNDSLNSVLTIDEISSLMTISSEVDYSDTMFMDEYEIEDFKASNLSYSYNARDLYQLEMTQDWIINNKKSVLVKENQSLSFFIPADHPDNIKGYQIPLFTIKYDDCVKLWKSDPNAIWFNPYNDNQHISLENAFQLELYSSYIIKVSNPDGEYIEDNFTGKEAILESKRTEHRFMEYESNIWEN